MFRGAVDTDSSDEEDWGGVERDRKRFDDPLTEEDYEKHVDALEEEYGGLDSEAESDEDSDVSADSDSDSSGEAESSDSDSDSRDDNEVYTL